MKMLSKKMLSNALLVFTEPTEVVKDVLTQHRLLRQVLK